MNNWTKEELIAAIIKRDHEISELEQWLFEKDLIIRELKEKLKKV